MLPEKVESLRSCGFVAGACISETGSSVNDDAARRHTPCQNSGAFSEWQRRGSGFEDRLHPSPAGHYAMGIRERRIIGDLMAIKPGCEASIRG